MAQRFASLVLLLCLPCLAAPAAAGVNGFTLINKSGAALSAIAVRRIGSSEWAPLSATPAPGASVKITFDNPDCAFDLRATIAGAGPATWRGVNLCDVKSVTLNRDGSGRTWVDYD